MLARDRGREGVRRILGKLKAKAENAHVGPSDDPSNYMGPVISAAREEIDPANISRSGKKEGRLVAGGDARSERTDTSSADRHRGCGSPRRAIFQEEIFGPVLAVTKAKNFDDALQLANDSQYGLTGAVFSNNPEHLRQAREQFFVGNLYFNRKCTGAMVGAHPFGGFNMSGTDSKAGGPDYLLLFLQAKSVATKV